MAGLGWTGAYGAAAITQKLEDLLAQRELDRQKQAAEALLLRRQAEEERANLAGEALKGRELEESGALRQLQLQSLEQKRGRDEAYRRDALAQSQQQHEATQRRLNEQFVMGLNAQTSRQPSLQEIEAQAAARARGTRRGAPLRPPSAGPTLGMPAAYFTWIQGLPKDNPNDPQTATQKALKFAPAGSNPQRITQAVREAFGLTARPTAGEQGRVAQDVRLRLQQELDDWEIEGADLSDEEYVTGRQMIRDRLLGNAGQPR